MIRRAATNRVLNVLRHWVSKHAQVGAAGGSPPPASRWEGSLAPSSEGKEWTWGGGGSWEAGGVPVQNEGLVVDWGRACGHSPAWLRRRGAAAGADSRWGFHAGVRVRKLGGFPRCPCPFLLLAAGAWSDAALLSTPGTPCASSRLGDANGMAQNEPSWVAPVCGVPKGGNMGGKGRLSPQPTPCWQHGAVGLGWVAAGREQSTSWCVGAGLGRTSKPTRS